MNSRPSRAVVAAEVLALVAAVALAIFGGLYTNWDLALLLVLIAIAIVSDLIRIDLPAERIAVSASFLAIVTAAVFLGGPPPRWPASSRSSRAGSRSATGSSTC